MKRVIKPEIIRDQAWMGDAVLALFVRQWILKQGIPSGPERHDRFIHFTSNQFLSALGEPTQIEAEIGAIYESEGIPAAFAYIESTLLPLYLRQHEKRQGSLSRF